VFDEVLEKRIANRLEAAGAKFATKKMFGGVCFMVDGKMCLGVTGDSLMVRFDPERNDEILARDGAREMDFTNRPMKGYAFVDPQWIRSEAELAEWIEIALEFNPRAKSSKKEKTRNG
jgi:TfoX/Sxy family transcriptional regulator of competence genes